jgi:hypothetical protein
MKLIYIGKNAKSSRATIVGREFVIYWSCKLDFQIYKDFVSNNNL